MRLLTTIICSLVLAWGLQAQCETWLGSPQQEDAENAHVVYRQFVKNKDYAGAYAQWKIAFDLAPAADGKRDSHFRDGIEIYKHFLKEETDKAKQDEYKAKIMDLYETLAECIRNQTIAYRNCADQVCIDQRVGLLMGRQAFDMYYHLQPPRAETYKVIKEAVRLADNASEYIVLKPYADLLVYLYSNERITAEEVRAAHAKLIEIADYNIDNDETYGPYYEQAKASMQGSIAKIESRVYDCAYFVDKLRPEYEEAPTDVENVKRIIATLKRQGCQPDQPFLAKLEAEYAVFAAAYNDSIQRVFEQNNPAIVAKRLYDEGDWKGAIEKYQAAIEKETDPEKKASYYFSIASIQFRKLDQYSAARNNAREAAKLRDGWGRPYMLIGDMYAKSSSSCGNDAYTRGLAVLAALDKWSHAKSIDESVAAEANRNIARFSQYMPPEEDAFMMGKKAGQTETVGCWIGEPVRLRFN
ncbi:MAG: hypothetical protein R3301_11350 [Saprospiraceae bacterium]|nr:hypothetical protein [Saprospiraceae bacterium]